MDRTLDATTSRGAISQMGMLDWDWVCGGTGFLEEKEKYLRFRFFWCAPKNPSLIHPHSQVLVLTH